MSLAYCPQAGQAGYDATRRLGNRAANPHGQTTWSECKSEFLSIVQGVTERHPPPRHARKLQDQNSLDMAIMAQRDSVTVHRPGITTELQAHAATVTRQCKGWIAHAGEKTPGETIRHDLADREAKPTSGHF
jgi:hypothetical protein